MRMGFMNDTLSTGCAEHPFGDDLASIHQPLRRPCEVGCTLCADGGTQWLLQHLEIIEGVFEEERRTPPAADEDTGKFMPLGPRP